MNPAEMEQLRVHSSIKEYGVSLKVGEVSSPLFKNNRVEVLHVDDSYAKHTFVDFIEGGLPSGENEIVLNTWELDMLGAKHQLGAVVRLDIDTDEKVISQNFTVSGYYEADKNLAMSGLAFVSKAFTDKNISGINPDHSEATGSYVNTSRLSIMLDNSFHIEEKIRGILAETGLKVEYGVNPA